MKPKDRPTSKGNARVTWRYDVLATTHSDLSHTVLQQIVVILLFSMGITVTNGTANIETAALQTGRGAVGSDDRRLRRFGGNRDGVRGHSRGRGSGDVGVGFLTLRYQLCPFYRQQNPKMWRVWRNKSGTSQEIRMETKRY